VDILLPVQNRNDRLLEDSCSEVTSGDVMFHWDESRLMALFNQLRCNCGVHSYSRPPVTFSYFVCAWVLYLTALLLFLHAVLNAEAGGCVTRLEFPRYLKEYNMYEALMEVRQSLASVIAWM
jgi:hypothetical protein